jgi:futalosine hydrolase
MSLDLLLCVAIEAEGALLREHLAGTDRIQIVRMGVGAVNAAHAVTLAVTRDRPGAIIVCGVGGAYPGSGLRVGDVACAASEVYGDLGVMSPGGFLDMQALGLPVIDETPPLYNTLPMQIFPSEHRATFVTVNACTGTNDAALALQARTGGAVENMEGAAVAHVARLHGVPAGEIRGISNMAGDRDRSAWRLPEAAAAAQEVLLAWIAQR